MNTNQGALYFGAGIDMTEWRKNIEEIRKDILKLQESTQKEPQDMDKSFKKVSKGVDDINKSLQRLQKRIVRYFSFGFLKDFTSQLINVRGEFQRTEIAFTTMLQSQEKANDLMRELVDLAAKTPFNMSDVTDGAKRLLAFQVPAEEVTETLRRMGDVASGLGVPMGQLIHVYGQVKAQGKMMTNDLYQFMNAGIPILAELGKVLNKTESEIKDMVSEGKIGFDEIQQVIKGMTNEGGLFFNLMEAQSASLTGQIANLEDAIEQMFNELGRSMEGTLSTGIEAVATLVENYDKILPILAGLISSYGTYKVALMTVSAAEKTRTALGVASLVTENGMISAKVTHATVTKALTMAQAKLNAVVSANPYVAIATVLAGLVAVMWGLNDSVKTATDRLGEYNDEMKRNKSEAETLIGVIKSETATYLEKADAVKKLQDLAPETFANMSQEEIKAMDLADAHKKVAEELEKQKIAKEKQDLTAMEEELALLEKIGNEGGRVNHTKRIEQLKKDIEHLKRLDQERTETLMAQNEPLEKQLEYWQKNEKAINQEIDRIKKLHPEIDITKAKAGQIPDEFAKIQTTIDNLDFSGLIARILQVQRNIQRVNNEIEKKESGEETKSYGQMNKLELDTKKKEIQDKMYQTTNNGEISKYKAEIGLINKELEKYSESTQKAVKNTDKLGKSTKSVKNEPIKGSLGDYERQLSALNDQINNKTLATDTKMLNALFEKRKNLEEKIAEIRSKLNKASFDEEVNLAQKQTELRDKLLQLGYDKNVVDRMYPKVKDKSFLEYLQATQKELEDLMKTGKGSEQVAENLLNIKERIKAYNDEKSFIDGINEQIENLKKNLSGDELITALEKIKKLSVNETEEETRLKDNLIKKAIEDEEKRQREKYQDFLREHRNYEEQKEAITKEFEELRKQAQNDYEDGKIDEARFEEITIKINKEESKRQIDAFINELQGSDRWGDVFKDMDKTATIRLQNLLAELKSKLSEAKSYAEREKIQIHIDAVEKQLKSREKFSITKSISEIREKAKAYKQARKEEQEAEQELAEAQNDTTTSSEALEKAMEKLEQKSQATKNALQGLKDETASLSDKMKAFANFGKESVGIIQGAFNDLGINLNNGFGDALEKLGGAFEGVGMVAEGIASGNPIKMIGGVAKVIGSLFNNDRKKERAIQREVQALNNLKGAYENLSHAANKAFGSRKYNSQTALIQNLEQQKVHLQNMIRQEQSKKKTDHNKIADWQNQINAINRSIDDIKTDVIRDVLQTDVVDAAAKVGDALVEAFGKGEDAVESLEKVANDMLKNMLKNQLNLKIQEKMEPILDRMMEQSGIDEYGRGSFAGFSSAQMQNFKDEVRRAGEQMNDFLEAYKEIFQELDNNADQSLKGSIKGITEQTANVLAGQMNAIRMNIGEILKNSAFNIEIVRESVVVLHQIEYNTRALLQIKKDISEMNNKSSTNSIARANGLD